MKNKRIDSVKRWSLKTWKAQSGRETTPNLTPTKLSNTGMSNKSTTKSSVKGAKEIHGQGPYARDRIPRTSSLRSSDLEISVKPVPIPSRKRATTFREHRWSPLTSPTALDVIEEQPSPQPAPLHRHAASVTHIPRQPSVHHRVPKKAASTSMLRPESAQESHLAVPSPPRISNASDQRHIQPALRSQASPNVAATDQRQIHPALRNELGPRLSSNDQRNIHPALRNELGPSQDKTDPQRLHPALRSQPSITSAHSWCTISTAASAQPIVRTIPRVRIIPPSTLIDPDDTPAAYVERAKVASRPPPLSDQQILLENMNTARAAVPAAPLDRHNLFSNRAQHYVDTELPPLPPPKPTSTAFKRHMSVNMRDARPRATRIEQIKFSEDRGAHAVRLISPPGLGALACAELWAGGKYERHKTVKTSQVLEQHRYTLFPEFESDDMESMIPMVADPGHGHSHSHGHIGSGWCGCAGYDSWLAVTDERWKSVGIGCAEDGRWVMKLWEPVPDTETARSL